LRLLGVLGGPQQRSHLFALAVAASFTASRPR
jgi:hypothetical protein